jgi:hypothetical protein
MSCDNTTTCTAIADLASSSSLEPRDFRTADETHVACDQPLTWCRSGPTRDRSKAKAHAIPDSTQTVPEYVWGDEGPVND